MAITWKLDGIENWEEVCCHMVEMGKGKKKKLVRKLHPRTEIIIFMTIIVGLNEITKKNIEEWLLRCAILKKCNRCMGVMPNENGELKDWWPSRKDLEEHIGLWVNTFPAKTRAQFRTMTMKAVEQDVLDEMRRAETKKDDEEAA